jgi:hypothetical protein
MKNKAYDLTTYAFSKGEPILLDANVWLFLYPAPSGKPSSSRSSYSAAFKNMLSAGVSLVLDALILSEYLNRYCRIEWQVLHKAKHPDFKKFRKLPEYVGIGNGAAIFARSILKFCTKHDHPFSSVDVEKVLSDFECGACDFNDGLFVETCRQNGWKLVTHDADFINGGIEILTSNPNLLSACS